MLLNKEDRICVVAPSSSIEDGDYIELNKGKEFVEKYVKEVVIDDNVMSLDVDVKAKSLNKALSGDFKLVIAACGGEGAIRVVSKIDIENVKNSIMGFSDITSILNYIYLEKNIVTYHGCNLKTFGRDNERKMSEKCYEDFIKSFLEEDYLIQKEEFKIIKEGKGKGVIIGGNLTCFLQLADIYEIDLEGKVLFIEDLGYETSSIELKKLFKKLKMLKNFNKLNGVILGNYEVDTKEKIEEIYLSEIDLNIPTIKTENIGHGKTNLIIPIGKTVVIDKNKIKFI